MCLREWQGSCRRVCWWHCITVQCELCVMPDGGREETGVKLPAFFSSAQQAGNQSSSYTGCKDLFQTDGGKFRCGQHRVRVQAVSPRRLTCEARFRSQATWCGICGGQSGTGTCCSRRRSGLPCQYDSSSGPHSQRISLTTDATYKILAVGRVVKWHTFPPCWCRKLKPGPPASSHFQSSDIRRLQVIFWCRPAINAAWLRGPHWTDFHGIWCWGLFFLNPSIKSKFG
jgi:hypothetical protein